VKSSLEPGRLDCFGTARENLLLGPVSLPAGFGFQCVNHSQILSCRQGHVPGIEEEAVEEGSFITG